MTRFALASGLMLLQRTTTHHSLIPSGASLTFLIPQVLPAGARLMGAAVVVMSFLFQRIILFEQP